MTSIKLTVLFDDPFWIGIFERTSFEGYSVAKIIYGAEPSEQEVFTKVINYFPEHFSQPQNSNVMVARKVNPKRRKREAAKELKNSSQISKAHEAVKQFVRESKVARKKRLRQKRMQDAEQKFLLKQVQKKQKQRGK